MMCEMGSSCSTASVTSVTSAQVGEINWRGMSPPPPDNRPDSEENPDETIYESTSASHSTSYSK